MLVPKICLFLPNRMSKTGVFLGLFSILSLALLNAGCGKRQNPTPQLASGNAFVIPSDSVREVFKSKPIPFWAAKKFSYKPAKTRHWDLLHTKLELSFDWPKKEMYGVATLQLVPYFYPQKTLVLDAKFLEINSLVSKKGDKILASRFHSDTNQIRIDFDKTWTKGEKLTVQIQYTARPDQRPEGGGRAVKSNKGLFFINPTGTEEGKPRQLWTQGEPESASAWFPTIDSPNERCTQEMHITVEKSQKTLSNGVLLYSKDAGSGLRTDVWEMTQSHSPYLFMMAIGDFAVIKDKWRKIPLQYWVEPKYQDVAKSIFGQTPRMMEYFSNKLGVDYPWPKYDQVVVRDFVSGAMENTTASVFMEALQSTKKELVDHDWDDIIAHELFHQWFGDLVTLESWANLPLNESFANYSQYLWDEYKNGEDDADLQSLKEKQAYFFEANRKREPLVRFYHHQPDDMFDSHSYAKGGRILHMLRKWLGNEAFFEGLKLYLTKHAYQSTEMHQLRLAFEEVSGQDLNWFFNQWFYSAGHPELEVRYSVQNDQLVLLVSQNQDTLYSPVYYLPVKVEIWSGGDCEVKTLEIRKTAEKFTIPLKGPFQTLIWDSDHQFLGELDMAQPLQVLSAQYQLASRGIHRLEAIQKLKQDFPDYRETIKTYDMALDDTFWPCRQIALEGFGTLDSAHLAPKLEKIKALAINDPKPSVRTQALKLLARTPFSGKQALVTKALTDSSLSVSSMAYKIYINENYPDLEEKLKMIPAQEEELYAGVFAAYYSNRPEKTQALDWFLQKLERPDLYDAYSMALSFGQWMGKSGDSTQISKGLNFLFQKAMAKSKPELVIGAYQVIHQFRAKPGAVDMLLKIKDAWKGDELEEILNYIE